MTDTNIAPLMMALEEAESEAQTWRRKVCELKQQIAESVAEFKVGDVVVQTMDPSPYHKSSTAAPKTTVFRITRIVPDDRREWRDGKLGARYGARLVRKDGTDSIQEYSVDSFLGPLRRANPEEIPGQNSALTQRKE